MNDIVPFSSNRSSVQVLASNESSAVEDHFLRILAEWRAEIVFYNARSLFQLQSHDLSIG